MVFEHLVEELPQLGIAVAIFAVAFPLERAFGTQSRGDVYERLRNLGAMLVHFTLGGACVFLIMSQPIGQRLTGFPGEPRWQILENPALWAAAELFVVDGLYYVYHRLQHSVPLLWHIHKIHHTDPAVNITTSKRTHFLERPLQFLLLIVPSLWILGINAGGLVYLAFLGPFFLYFAHLDLRLPLGPLTPIIVGPHYHRVHHSVAASESQSNFAQAFPVFDIVGGTYHRPGAKEFPTTGVEDCRTTAQRWRPLIW